MALLMAIVILLAGHFIDQAQASLERELGGRQQQVEEVLK